MDNDQTHVIPRGQEANKERVLPALWFSKTIEKRYLAAPKGNKKPVEVSLMD